MLDKQAVKELKQIVGDDAVFHAPEDLITFEYDATIETALPDVVVLPKTPQQVAAIIRLAARLNVPIVPRGAGTGLSGGCVPVEGGIVIVLTRMNRILELDAVNRLAVVEAGVINFQLDRAARKRGLFFAPDPSSYRVCTIGGNVAENAGGPHCLAYGVTTNHILGLELVLADGSIVEVGGKTRDIPGYDLTGLVTGSEGTLAMVTKATVRLMPVPETGYTLVAQFKDVVDAAGAVSQMIAKGIVPQCMEMSHFEALARLLAGGGEPAVTASLIVEVEGLEENVAVRGPAIREVLEASGPAAITVATEAAERAVIWEGRRAALGTVGRIARNYYVLDGVSPRSKLPQVLRQVGEISQKYGLMHSSSFHAGDGNLHPTFVFDGSQPETVQKVMAAGEEIMRLCVEAGGSITGEHGVGLEKREFMRFLFDDADLSPMLRMRKAFGAEMFNPGKIFPTKAAAE
ncbi:MAG: FAD-binding protein [Dehalococcoidia bacterium]|nr:FAD-binding protein [Dehalococcoidia bacterium]